MSTRSALAGAITTAALVGALGSPAAVEAGREADSQTVGHTLTTFADWSPEGLNSDEVAVVIVRLAVALVLVAGLGAVAGRSRSRSAAFLAGWGTLLVSTAVAGAASYLYAVNVVLDGDAGAPTLADGIATAANAASTFGLWTGWVVGLAVALAMRTAAATATAPGDATKTATTPATRRIAEPPPPWWAPTPAGAGDGALRPGPTVFLPGGGHTGGAESSSGAALARRHAPPPVIPEATYEMTTASGDPHPSDPDATSPIGMPLADADATRPHTQPDPNLDDDGPAPDGPAATAPITADDRDAARQTPRPDT